MILDDGKCGHYDYRLHVTGYVEIRDDFLSSIEEMKQIHVVGVLRRGTRPRRRRRSDMKQIHIYMGDTSTLGNSLDSVQLQFILVRWLTLLGTNEQYRGWGDS